MSKLYILLGVTVVALIVLVIIYFRNKKKAERAAALEADAGLAPGGDDISVLIHEAEGKLAAAKLGPAARVGNVPVYIVMGDPGTTKTSVMLHSGLEPELLSGQVYQAGNVSPTRTANFWFSRRSVFVEAGGPLLNDANKWRTLVKRLQPRASVVGKGEQAGRAAVVCFDCETFTKPGALDLAANAARNLRARLGEISQAMGINLPVYALFTKTDRLPFFTDYVRNLNNDEATQVLGVTLPMVDRRGEGVYGEQETARLTAFFEQLFHSLADGRPEFLSREGDAAKLPGAYEFPREFRKIRPALVQFLVDLCRPSQLTVGPFLRGFYFTGVRPVVINESAPVTPAPQQQAQSSGAAAAATGIFRPGLEGAAQQQPAAPPVMTTRKVPQWLFLSHLFNDVLLADRAALGASGASIKVSGARRILYLAAASVCLLLTIFFTISFFNNLGIESNVKAAVRGIPPGELAATEFAPVASLQKLDTLRQWLEKLMVWRSDGPPLFYKWGLYVGDDVYKSARPAYCSRFRQLLLKQTQANMLAYLQALPGSNTEYRPTYDALRSYLITTSYPARSDSQLAPVLMRFWMNDRTVESDRQSLARAQFDFYQKDLLIPDPCTASAVAPVVENARAYLKHLGGAQRVYQQMLSEANKKFPSVNFNRQFPGSERTVVDGYEVPGAFTKDGWKFMNNAIAHPDLYVKGEAWVLGDEGTANIDLAKVAQEIKPLYLNDFLKEWRAYLRAGKVRAYSDLRDASGKLVTLSGNQSTLLQMISLASQNTDVDDPEVKRVFQPAQAVVPPGSTDRVIAPPNQGYVSALGQLQIAIDGVVNQPGQAEAAAASANGVAGQAKGVARTLGQGFTIDKEGRVDQEVQRVLIEPITYAENLLRGAAPADLNAKGKALCAQIHPVLAKYPFTPGAAAQATLPEIDAVFKPNEGAIWQFVNGNLQKVVTKMGSRYSANPAGGVKINDAFLAFLNRAAAFSDAAFAGGTPDPHFNYTVRPEPSADLESVKLTIDGQTAELAGPSAAAKQFVWPGQSHGVNLTVKFKGGGSYNINTYEGLWAVFQWAGEADQHTGPLVEFILGSGRPKRPVTDVATGKIVSVKMNLDANPPIFDKGYFTFTCVANVAH